MDLPARPSVFSGRRFLAALALCVVGFLAVALSPLALFGLGGLLGLAAGAFVLGLRAEHRAYLEVGFAGAGAAGVVTVLTPLLAVVPIGPVPVSVVGAGGGLLAAVAGHYLGRDLRAGLSREV